MRPEIEELKKPREIYSLEARREVSKAMAERYNAERVMVFDDVAFAVPPAQRPKLHALPGYERILLPALMTGMEFQEGTIVLVTAPPNPLEMLYTLKAKHKLEEKLNKSIPFQIIWRDPTKNVFINLVDIYQRDPQEYLSLCLNYADWLDFPENLRTYTERSHLYAFQQYWEEHGHQKGTTLVMPFQMTNEHKQVFDELNAQAGNEHIVYPSIPEMDKLRNNLLLRREGVPHVPLMQGVTPTGQIIDTLEKFERWKEEGLKLPSNKESLQNWARAIVNGVNEFLKQGLIPYVKLDSDGVSGLGNLPPNKYPWLYDPNFRIEEKVLKLSKVLSRYYPEGSDLPKISVIEEFVEAAEIGGVKHDITVGGMLINGQFYPMSIFPFGVNDNDEYICGWMSPDAEMIQEDPELWNRLIEAFEKMGEILAKYGYTDGVLAGDVLIDKEGGIKIHDFNLRRGGRSYFESLVAIEGKPFFEAQVELSLEDLPGLNNRQRFILYTILAQRLHEKYGIIPFSTSFGYFGGDHSPEEPDFFKYKLAVPLELLNGERRLHFTQVVNLVTQEYNDLLKQIRIYSGKDIPGEGEDVILYVEDSVWPPYSAFELFKDVANHIKENDLPTPMTILDIGTGTGVLPVLMRRIFPEISTVVTDLNPQAVENAFINWVLNGGDPKNFHGIVGSDLENSVVTEIHRLEKGLPDLVIANLPQQPLNGLDNLEKLRENNPALWNVDASNDPDGLGIFTKVLQRIHEVTNPGTRIFITAASKQNWERIERLLTSLIESGTITSWQVIGTREFAIPESYDPRLIQHWLAREKQDGVKRIWKKDGRWYYTHYNLLIIR